MNGMDDKNQRSNENKATNTTLDDIYRDAMKVNPASRKSFLFVMYIITMILMIFLLSLIYQGYSGGMLDGVPSEMRAEIQAMLVVTALICIFTIVFFTLIMWITMQGDIKYNIEGEVQLDIRYEPVEAFSYNPMGSFGAIATVIFIIIFILYLFSRSGNIASGDNLIVLIFATAVMLKNIFSKRHYVLTELGMGYIFVGFKPITMFIEWEKFSGFSISEKHFHLHAKRNSLLLGLMFPKKIPVLDNLEDARFILQQYLTEL